MTTLAIAQCQTAITRGPLTPEGPHYRFGRRLFSSATVAAARAGLGVNHVNDETKRSVFLQVKLTKEERAGLGEMAEKEGRTPGNLVWWMIKQAIKAKKPEQDQ